MSGDPLRKARSGERLRIPAAAYNAFVDAAEDLKRRHTSIGAGEPTGRAYTTVLIQNKSGTDLNGFDVLGLDGPAVERVDNEPEFMRRVLFGGVEPAAEHAGRFAVAIEPIPSGAVGKAVVDGVCAVLVKMASEDHGYADVSAGNTGYLGSRARGSAQILWMEPIADREAAEDAWCIVQLGAWSKAGDVFAVTVTPDGGVAGSAVTNCTWTYTVKALDGTILGEDMTPEKRRYTNMPYKTTPDNTPGLAYFDADGDLHLFDANELWEEEEC